MPTAQCLGRRTDARGRPARLAHRVPCRLAIAAKVDKADRADYKTKIRSPLKDPLIGSIGEIGEGESGRFLGVRW